MIIYKSQGSHAIKMEGLITRCYCCIRARGMLGSRETREAMEAEGDVGTWSDGL